MDGRASRRYVSGCCSAPSRSAQDGHIPDSSKVRKTHDALRIWAILVTEKPHSTAALARCALTSRGHNIFPCTPFQMHLLGCFAVTLSAHVEEMSGGSHGRFIGAHFFKQVEPQIALGRLKLVVALIIG